MDFSESVSTLDHSCTQNPCILCNFHRQQLNEAKRKTVPRRRKTAAARRKPAALQRKKGNGKPPKIQPRLNVSSARKPKAAPCPKANANRAAKLNIPATRKPRVPARNKTVPKTKKGTAVRQSAAAKKRRQMLAKDKGDDRRVTENAYVNFVKQFCRDNTNLTLKQATRMAAVAWTGLPEGIKDRYRRQARRAIERAFNPTGYKI